MSRSTIFLSLFGTVAALQMDWARRKIAACECFSGFALRGSDTHNQGASELVLTDEELKNDVRAAMVAVDAVSRAAEAYNSHGEEELEQKKSDAEETVRAIRRAIAAAHKCDGRVHDADLAESMLTIVQQLDEWLECVKERGFVAAL